MQKGAHFNGISIQIVCQAVKLASLEKTACTFKICRDQRVDDQVKRSIWLSGTKSNYMAHEILAQIPQKPFGLFLRMSFLKMSFGLFFQDIGERRTQLF